MDIIRNYLENMFSRLPDTPEVQRAKNELWQMMEDKYTELKAEGRSENEAIGTVITEFGNLEELAETLGIHSYVQPVFDTSSAAGGNAGGKSDITPADGESGAKSNATTADGNAGAKSNATTANRESGAKSNATPAGGNAGAKSDAQTSAARLLTMDEARKYIRAKTEHALWLALGIFFCIMSPVASIVTGNTALADAVGPTGLFLCVAIGVFLIVFSGIRMQEWNFVKKNACCLDAAAAQYVRDCKKRQTTVYALFLTVGIALCIVSVVPVCIFDALVKPNMWVNHYNIGPAFLFLLVALGVFMIVLGSVQYEAYGTLLNLPTSSAMEGDYFQKQPKKDAYSNQTISVIMSVFWPTVTCLYLIWSFLTFDWGITWIIWPISAVIEALIKNNWKK